MNSESKRSRVLRAAGAAVVVAAVTTPAMAETAAAEPADPSSFWGALTSGKVDFYARYRLELVNDDQLPVIDGAVANTLRTALGYRTGSFHGFGAYGQFEDVRAIDDDKYSDGGANNVTDRATVADPQGTEVQQGYLWYNGLPGTMISVGRQEITHRPAPLQRYVSNVAWRQNWQSYDSLRITNESLPDTKLDYAYVWNVNRPFGEDNPRPDRANYRMDSHLIDAVYAGFKPLQLEGYAYLLDFNSTTSAPLSTVTVGGRAEGSYEVAAWPFKLLYAGEVAHQGDYRDNPLDISALYYLAELGGQHKWEKGWLESVTLKGSYEVLGSSDGVRGFQTPLATAHPFQGWADRFSTTPNDGVEDLFGTLEVVFAGVKLTTQYHDLSSENDDYDYGTEWDVMATRTFVKHYTVAVKYANYDADDNATNLARNGVTSTGKQAFDLEKFWLWLEVKF